MRIATLVLVLLIMVSVCLGDDKKALFKDEKKTKKKKELSDIKDHADDDGVNEVKDNIPSYGYGVNNHHYIPRQDFSGGSGDNGNG